MTDISINISVYCPAMTVAVDLERKATNKPKKTEVFPPICNHSIGARNPAKIGW